MNLPDAKVERVIRIGKGYLTDSDRLTTDIEDADRFNSCFHREAKIKELGGTVVRVTTTYTCEGGELDG
ncbi:hypothetical protein HCJ13_13970 [Listeria booriae]|uniref:hypothetical protein n=1 Tax=Listeria booriae TaxID=1552123 RepID=UPI001629AEA9|nr:hypothetical protein [Listeria booriae]MBC1651299.1 hypothetical protein [Listeria booriae]